MKKKTDRLQAIIHIIETQEICNQEDLLIALSKEGYTLTQATLSRDLKRLQIAKTPTARGAYCYTLPQASPMRVAAGRDLSAASGSITLQFSHNTGVMRTRPGYASSIAYDIDANAPAEILGTIAGDDTILLILHEQASHQQAYDALHKLIPQLNWIQE